MALENPKPLDMNTAVRCTRCHKVMKTVYGDSHRIGIYRDNACIEVICPLCCGDERVREWGMTGELNSGLLRDAQSAVMHVDEFKDTNCIRPDYAEMYQTYIGVYREVMRQYNEVNEAACRAEIAVWFGRPDRANSATLEASREWGNKWIERYELEKQGQPVPKFDLDLGSNAVKAYYEKSDKAGHSYYHNDFKILMLGTAGRVLTTISDVRPQSDPLSKFGGAHITLIFDESSDYPRGGIQSHIGTQQELFSLIEAYRSPGLKFQPDKKVSII